MGQVSVKNTASEVIEVTIMKAFSLVLVAFVSLSLLLFSGCTQKNQEPTVNETPVVQPPAPDANGTNLTPQQPCSSGNIVQKDECFAALAKSSSDPSVCVNIYSVEKLDDCYGYFSAGDIEVCKKVSNPEKRASCLTQNAVRAKSEELCSLIDNDDLRAGCLKQVVPPCMLLLDEDQRSLCFALEKNDSSRCSSDACLGGYAKNRSDVAACAKLSSLVGRFECIAVVQKTVESCKLADQAALRDSCVEQASIELGDLQGCDLATPGSDYANRCYLYFAVKQKDNTICRKPFQEEQRDACYSDYANETANVSSCLRVIETLNRIGCYRHAAIDNRLPSLCNDLGNSALMRDCYAASILYIDAGPVPSDCASVAEAGWKDKCYLRAAIKSNNGTYCSLIGEGPDKTDCSTLFPGN